MDNWNNASAVDYERYFLCNYRENGGTDAYIDAVMALTPDYMVLVIIVLAIVGGFLGTMLGKIVLKKHFEKAGIA